MKSSALGLMLLTLAWPAAQQAGVQIQGVPIQVQPPRDRPPTLRAGTGSLRGRVIDAHTGGGLARVRVRLQGVGGQRPPVLTDGEGAFAFASLPAGTYTLSTDKSTYMAGRYPEAGRLMRAGRQPLTLRDGEARNDLTIRMFHGGVLAGRVLDAHGDPVEFGDVRVLRVPRNGRPTMMGGNSTNDLGEFRIPRLEAGRYLLLVNSRRVGVEEPIPDTELPPQPVPTYYPGAVSADQAQPIVIERGQTIAGLEVVLGEGRHTVVNGLVVSADGQAVGSNGSVSSRPAGVEAGFGFQGGTGIRQDGSFRLQLPPGEFVIEARLMQQAKPNEPMRPENERFGSVQLSVGANAVENVVVQVGRGATASGRVVFDGASPPGQIPAQVRIPFYTPENPGCRAGQVTVAPDWTFKVEGLFGICSAPQQSMFGQWTLKSVLFRGRDLLEGTVTFEPGQHFNDVQVVFTNRRTELEFRVTDDRGEQTREYVGLVFPADKEKWKDLTRHVRTYVPPTMTQITTPRGGGSGVPSGVVAGVYAGIVAGQWSGASMQSRISGLPIGEYYVIAVDDIETEDSRDPAVLERLIPSAFRVTLTDAAKTEVDLRRVTLADVIR